MCVSLFCFVLIQWNIVDGVNQSLEDLGSALDVQGNKDAINKFNSLELTYSPGNDFEYGSSSTMAESARGGNEITFGARIGSHLNQTDHGFLNLHANAAITNGGRGTMAFLAAHEFGHSMDTTSGHKLEYIANNYVKILFPFFNKVGIDIPDVRVRE